MSTPSELTRSDGACALSSCLMPSGGTLSRTVLDDDPWVDFAHHMAYARVRVRRRSHMERLCVDPGAP
jgi:hypothetical protein